MHRGKTDLVEWAALAVVVKAIVWRRLLRLQGHCWWASDHSRQTGWVEEAVWKYREQRFASRAVEVGHLMVVHIDFRVLYGSEEDQEAGHNLLVACEEVVDQMGGHSLLAAGEMGVGQVVEHIRLVVDETGVVQVVQCSHQSILEAHLEETHTYHQSNVLEEALAVRHNHLNVLVLVVHLEEDHISYQSGGSEEDPMVQHIRPYVLEEHLEEDHTDFVLQDLGKM
jgi:hypothetical protein